MIFTRIFSECGPGEHGAAGDSDRGQDVRSGALLRGVAGGGAHQHGARACAMVRSGARGGDQGRRPRLGPGEHRDTACKHSWARQCTECLHESDRDKLPIDEVQLLLL